MNEDRVVMSAAVWLVGVALAGALAWLIGVVTVWRLVVWLKGLL